MMIREEQKRKAVDQVLVHNKFPRFVAKDFGVDESELKRWVEEHKRSSSEERKKDPWHRRKYMIFGPQKTAAPEKEELPPEEDSSEEKPVYQVTLSNGVFEKKDGEFAYNKPCIVKVNAELPRDCPRKKVTFSLFSVYKGREEDMNHKADGLINCITTRIITTTVKNPRTPK
jgi:transposase-like protein